MQELTNKTLLELKALCREYSCFKGYSSFTKKNDLIDFMANRITTLAEVSGMAMPVPVPVSEITISGFVPTPTTPAEPVPFEEDEPEAEPDEWVDPDDQLFLAAASCPHCEGSEVVTIGESQEVWRCSRCSAIGYTGDLVELESLPRYCPDPFVLLSPQSKEFVRMESWWRKRAQLALAPIAAEFRAIAKNNGGELHPPQVIALNKAISDAYSFGVKANHPYKIWLDERRKLLILLGVIKPAPKVLIRKIYKASPGQLSLLEAKDGEDDHKGGDPRRSTIHVRPSGWEVTGEPPSPSDYKNLEDFKRDWEPWVATQTDEAESDYAGVTAAEIWEQQRNESN